MIYSGPDKAKEEAKFRLDTADAWILATSLDGEITKVSIGANAEEMGALLLAIKACSKQMREEHFP